MLLSTPDWRLILSVTLLLVSISASADTRLVQVWTCTLNEGKTVEDLNTVHGKWVAWANKQSYGGDILGSVAIPTVSDDLGVVLIIDSYPDGVTYGADSDAYAGTAEGQALEAEYESVATCSSSAIYSETESG